jgi:hypothetical protein
VCVAVIFKAPVEGLGESFLNWTDREKRLLAMLGAFAFAVLLITAIYSRW